MTNEQKSSDLEDNLPMVNYIMLHRIYDLLTIIANKMVSYHEEGYLLGPAPSYSVPDEDENQQTLF